MTINYTDILKFWFEEVKPAQWWTKSDEFDQLIIDRYSVLYAQATRCELYQWRETAEGRLAEIIVLDQFSRNMFRGSGFAFAFDSLALALSQQALASGADQLIDEARRSFMYLPFMHSESKKIHVKALEIYQKLGNKGNIDFEIRHKAIIDRFGRYPHRNKVMGRESTDEEIEFLKNPGSGF